MDQLYFIANNNGYLELNKHKNTYNFSLIQEPLTLSGISETLIYN